MTIVTVRLASGRPAETKRKLSSSLTNAIVETLDVAPADVTILFEEYERENWAVGGELRADRARSDRDGPPLDLDALFRKPAPARAQPQKPKAKPRRRR